MVIETYIKVAELAFHGLESIMSELDSVTGKDYLEPLTSLSSKIEGILGKITTVEAQAPASAPTSTPAA